MKKKMIIAIIIVVILIVAGTVGVIFYQKRQENKLIEEVNKISSLDITKDEIDMNIKASGKYGEVERTIKEYLNQYATYIKQASQLLEDEQLMKVLTAQNYQEDGPEFAKTKEYLASTKQQFSENMQKLIDMSTEEAIMKQMEDKNLSETYVNLYRDLMFDEEILNQLKETKTVLEKTNGMIQQVIGIQEEVIQLLIDNKNKWVIDGDKIQFTSRTALNQYNELIEKLSSIEE